MTDILAEPKGGSRSIHHNFLATGSFGTVTVKINGGGFEMHTQNTTRPSAPTMTRAYPSGLVGWFGVGILLFVVGLIILGVGTALGSFWTKTTAAILLVVGSLSVSLSVLRGQDIDERAR